MATIILNQGEQSTISNDGDVVRGRQGGQETILIPNNVTGIETNAEIERADLALELSELSFQATSSGFEISDGSNTILTLPSLNQELDLRLADGNLSLSQTGAQEFTLSNPDNPNDSAAIGTNALAGSNLQVGLGNDISSTVPGDELIEGDDQANELTPDSSDSSFQTSDLNETIRGFDGDDTVDGGGGEDTVEAGDGNDLIIYDSQDASLDGQAGFDKLETPAVENSTFGSNNDDFSLQTVSNVQVLDTRNSQGGNTFDLSDLLVDSITGGENTFGVLENNLAFLTGSEVDEIDLGDITPPSGSFQVGAEAPITIPIIRADEDGDGNADASPNLNNPGNAKAVQLTRGENAILVPQGDNGDFTVPNGSISNPNPTYYIGSDEQQTVTAEFNDLSDNNGFGNDTIAAAGQGQGEEDILSLENSLPGDLTQQLGPLAFVSGFEQLNLENASVNNNLIINNQVLGQLTRGEPTVQGADTLRVVTASGTETALDTQGIGSDDTVIVQGGAFDLADQRSGSNLLQGNLITIADAGAGIITGGNGNDSINGGAADDYVDLRPTQGNTVSGQNVVTGGAGEDTIVAGADEDSLEGGEDDDRFIFDIDPDTEVSRLDSQDTVNGGIGQEDTLALAANTRLDSLSEIDNVTRVEIIELNGNSTDGEPVVNEVTLTNNVVTTADATLTVDASAPGDVDERNNSDRPGEVKAGFELLDGGSDKLDDSFDNNLVNLFNLAEDVDSAVEGGNAHERVIFSDTSFSGNQTINGGDGDIDPSSVGLPVIEIAGTEFDAPQDTPTVVKDFKTSVTDAERLDVVDGISNFDTLDFRAQGGEPFTAVPTDYNNISGIEEIQLSNSVPNTNSNFELTLNNNIVRQLTQTTSAGSTTQGQPVNLNLSLDQIEEIGGANVTSFSGRQIGQDSTVELVTAGLVDSLNTVTVRNPNGVDTVIENIIGSPQTITAEDLISFTDADGDGSFDSGETITAPTTARVGRVNVSPSDLITTAELAATNGEVITQEYQLGEALGLGDPSDDRTLINNEIPISLPTVVVTVGHNFQENPAQLEFTANNVNHQVITGDGDFVITTAQGDDTITSGSGDDDISTGDGDDTIFVGSGGDDTIDGGNGFDTVSFANVTDGVTVDLATEFTEINSIEVFVGSEFDDEFTGTDDADRIDGAAGNDTIFGLAGDDTLFGGEGEDSIDSGEGNDFVAGDNGLDGDDTLIGAAGDDTLVGELNNDSLDGGLGDDSLVGDGEVNPVSLTISQSSSQPGEDTLEGGAGNDTLRGGQLSDTLDGGEDDDLLFGGTGDDTIFGSTGDDTVNGGENSGDNDTLDYNRLDSQVTLLSFGRNAKGGRTANDVPNTGNDTGATDGIDQLTQDPTPTIERIVGDEDFNADNADTPSFEGVNAIDGVNGSFGSFANANLATNTLEIDFNNDGTSDATFTVENFVNVFGNNNGDTIVGDDADNVIGGSGLPYDGSGQSDSLTGNGGNDQFLFVEDTDFADDNNGSSGSDGNMTAGNVSIVDFQPGLDQFVADVGTNSNNRTTNTTVISTPARPAFTQTVTSDAATGNSFANAVAAFASMAFTGSSINLITGIMTSIMTGTTTTTTTTFAGGSFGAMSAGGFSSAVALPGFAGTFSSLSAFQNALVNAMVTGIGTANATATFTSGFLAFAANNEGNELFYASGLISGTGTSGTVQTPLLGSGSVTIGGGSIQASDIFLV